MNQSIDPSRIDWEGNGSKREADLTMYRALAFDIQRMRAAKGGKPVRVLSFPGPTWMWELGLSDVFRPIKFDFTGLESSKDVWKKLVKAAGGLPGKLHMLGEPMKFLQYAESRDKRSKPFDIVYLDWMGTWSREKQADIDALFRGAMLNEGGVLITTVSLRHGRPETMDELTDISYDLPMAFYDARGEDKYVSNVKVRGIPHWVESRAMDVFEVKMRPIMASVYYSESSVSTQEQPQLQPQLQLMFLRES